MNYYFNLLHFSGAFFGTCFGSNRFWYMVLMIYLMLSVLRNWQTYPMLLFFFCSSPQSADIKSQFQTLSSSILQRFTSFVGNFNYHESFFNFWSQVFVVIWFKLLHSSFVSGNVTNVLDEMISRKIIDSSPWNCIFQVQLQNVITCLLFFKGNK